MSGEVERTEYYCKLWNDQKSEVWRMENEVKDMQVRLDVMGMKLNERNTTITVLVEKIERFREAKE